MNLHLSDLLLSGPLAGTTIRNLDGDPSVSSLKVVRDWAGLRTVTRADVVLLDLDGGQGGWMLDAAVRMAWQAYAAAVVVPDEVCLFDSPSRLAARYRVCLLTVPIADRLAFQLDLGQQIRDHRADLAHRLVAGITAITSADGDPQTVLATAQPFLGRMTVGARSPGGEWLAGPTTATPPSTTWRPPGDPAAVWLDLWLQKPAEADAVEQLAPLLAVLVQRLTLWTLAPREVLRTRKTSSASWSPSDTASLLERVLDSDDWRAAATQLLSPLQGSPRSSKLLVTLSTYLDSGSVIEAAGRLQIHRNTAATRIAQVEKRLGLTLSDPDVRLALHLACRASGVVSPRPDKGHQRGHPRRPSLR